MALTREKFARCQRGLQGPGWRSKTAQEMTNVNSLSVAQLGDPLTIAAVKYFALRADDVDGRERAAAAYPKIEAAIALHDDNDKTDVVKLMILADFPVAAIGTRVGVEPEVIQVWEELFFDVRGMRSATNWLSMQVVNHEHKAGNTELAARMKVAIVAGIDGVNAVLALDEGAPVDEAERLFQRKLKLSLKFDAAAEMPIDSERSRLAFIKLYVHLQLSERHLELAGKNLSARCAEARNRHELANLQMEYSQERKVLKANEKRQQTEQRRQAQEARNDAATRAQELQHYARLANQKTAACRAAQSPLARLTWGKSQPIPVTSPDSSLLLTLGKQGKPMHEIANWAHAHDTAAYPYDTGSQTGLPELEIVIPGAA